MVGGKSMLEMIHPRQNILAVTPRAHAHFRIADAAHAGIEDAYIAHWQYVIPPPSGVQITVRPGGV